ncbi:MAG: SAM-dependent DNA methyltransferase, partial [bacterium]|nr:SAM-dependent DNA methyltransferase [bacterium]
MATKRQILERLKRNELLAALDAYELVVDDRRQRDLLVSALGRSRKARLAEILAELSRDRLKEICRELELNDRGRRKAELVDRLTGQAPAGVRPQARERTDEGQPAPTLDTAERGRLTREQLEGYLWSAADILRGSIDSSDYKNYIFGLLFLKRLSDRFEEECEALVAEGVDPEDPDEHQFFVPARARWPRIRKATT